MIPVKIKLHTSRNRDEEFSYEVVSDEFLTPLLMGITVFNSIGARELLQLGKRAAEHEIPPATPGPRPEQPPGRAPYSRSGN